MVGLVLAFITYLGWGTGDIFGAYASRKIGAYKATSLILIFGLVIASFFIPLAWNDLGRVTPILFILNFIFGIIIMLGQFFVNEAFRKSSVSLVGIIIQSFPAVVLILSTFFFQDPISTKQIYWIVIIFAGVFLSMVNFKDLKRSQLLTDMGIRLALISAGMFSVYFTFTRIFVDTYGWFWPNYFSFLSFPVAIILFKKLFKVKEKLNIPKSNKILLATLFSALLLRGGDIALNYGIASGFTSTVTPIASASPTLFVLLSSIIFKDQITKQQRIGIAISLLGIILLSFFSG